MTKTLCIIDVQNDFCHPEGFFPKKGLVNVEGIDDVVNNIQRVLEHWRSRSLPVVWVQAIGEGAYLSATQKVRFEALGSFCKEGTWGADFYCIAPAPRELVFKKGGYDPFFQPTFKHYTLSSLMKGDSLVLAGLFSERCITATASHADHLGIPTEIARDCSRAMSRSHKEAIEDMAIHCGTRVYASTELLISEVIR